MKKLLVVLMSVLMVMPGIFVHAQQPPPAQGSLEYGVPLESVLTDTAPEVAFTFEGAEGDVVVVEMYPVEQYTEGNITASMVKLFDPSQTQVGAEDSGFFENVRYVAELAVSGKHTIVATYPPDSTDFQFGKFFIAVHKAVDLSAGEISDEMTSDDRRYYTVTSEKSFTLDYAQTGGSFMPLLSINALGGEDNLTELGFLRGAFENASLTVDASQAPSPVFVVILERDLGDFIFNPIEVNYTLSLRK